MALSHEQRDADRRARVEQYLAAGWTDQEMGRVFNRATSTVGSWRLRWGLKPARKCRKNFLRLYGPDALTRLEQLIRAGASYRAIAADFGFTPQYAHVVCRELGFRTRRSIQPSHHAGGAP